MSIPLGIVAEPGKDVFAKDDRESKSSARTEADQADVSPGGDAERVVSVVSAEEPSSTSAEGGVDSLAGGVGEPVEAAEASVAVPVVEEAVVAAAKKPEGPLDHEEALADQVAHELYPEARDVSEGHARDE
ncbi:hypothetical protein OG21DRAFT_1038726 [Imleria badia]|nr:hypothetical protein OG21DRAFT_1038726 [Imleria badia]